MVTTGPAASPPSCTGGCSGSVHPESPQRPCRQGQEGSPVSQGLSLCCTVQGVVSAPGPRRTLLQASVGRCCRGARDPGLGAPSWPVPCACPCGPTVGRPVHGASAWGPPASLACPRAVAGSKQQLRAPGFTWAGELPGSRLLAGLRFRQAREELERAAEVHQVCSGLCEAPCPAAAPQRAPSLLRAVRPGGSGAQRRGPAPDTAVSARLIGVGFLRAASRARSAPHLRSKGNLGGCRGSPRPGRMRRVCARTALLRAGPGAASGLGTQDTCPRVVSPSEGKGPRRAPSGLPLPTWAEPRRGAVHELRALSQSLGAASACAGTPHAVGNSTVGM